MKFPILFQVLIAIVVIATSIKLIFDAFFFNTKLYRMIYGGYYELWYVDHPICSEIWHQVPEFSTGDQRPSTLCRGRAIKQEYHKGFRIPWLTSRD